MSLASLSMFCFHQGQVLLQDHPHVLIIVLELVTDGKVHIYECSIFKSHAFCQSWVLIMKVFVSVECYI